MAGPAGKKRANDSGTVRIPKKQKRKQQYHSESEDDAQDFDAVNLLDSDDDDIHNARVEDLSDQNDASSDASSSDGEQVAQEKTTKQPKGKKLKDDDSPAEDEDDSEEDNEDEDEDMEYDEADGEPSNKKTKSKRNDPTAFATSLSKILSTKLSSSRRADPVLARNADAQESSRAAVDAALEAKAKKQLRDQKRKALEKGRVKDVLVATTNHTTGEVETSTATIMETERRLRKVAQRGVVRLFNAVRAAQVKAVEAEKNTKKQGVIGISRREEKVNEMSKKGFLELIASGGGGLKKGALEEA
ncbi:Rrp15p-domain-containing protein [Stachybotrys elegans]|uniref:Rrp15p-domain-containing protein n=1 Tax=Stachybotrys elegans TaxID=80388 RepID=A0A8K0SP06_9HYPO|nr:Rrp15p-domain-containing protein [Stachybotrys elegans]